eukprot:GHVR01134184.1.p1 GENE.GHVR01134184.1~~GHVR01134184.1.p1  ORF type:complete len:171 (+),score=53.37 GHVR01134184.1:18-530(+)
MGSSKEKRQKKKTNSLQHTHKCWLVNRAHRRVATWRTVVIGGESQLAYVDLGGNIISKNKGHSIAKMEKKYLKQKGISETGDKSSILNVEDIEPYSYDLGSNPNFLDYWCVPPRIIQAYHNEGVTSLHEWQVECLALVWPTNVPIKTHTHTHTHKLPTHTPHTQMDLTKN